MDYRLVIGMVACCVACGPEMDPMVADASTSGGSTHASSSESTETSSSTSSTSTSTSSGSESGASMCSTIDEIGRLFGSACGDLSLVGSAQPMSVAGELSSLLTIVRVPPMIDLPFDEDGFNSAVFGLPHPNVDVRVQRGPAEPECDPQGDYPHSGPVYTAAEGQVEVVLVDRAVAGCIFTCADTLVTLRNVTFVNEDCDEAFAAEILAFEADIFPD